MMFRSGDLNLNRSLHAFGDWTMERLKQGILQHELIFRNQVCELHRLYWIQKNLMNELRIKGIDTDVPSSCSWLHKESQEKKDAFSLSSRAKENSLARNVGALEEFKNHSTDLLKNHQRDFNLHLSADDFIRSNGEDPIFYHQASNFRCEYVIDLENSLELEFHKVINDQVSSAGFRAAMQNGGLLQEQKSAPSYVAIGEPCIDASLNQPRMMQQEARPILFDLNLPHEDERSYDLNAMLEQEKLRSSSHSDIKWQDSNITSSNSTNLPQTVNKDLETKPTDHEGIEEDTSSSHSIFHDEISPSRKFLTESSNTDDSVTTQLNSSQNEVLLIGKLKPEEGDATIVSAAEALMSIITSGCSAIPIQQPDNIDSSSNLPQDSSDSFECLTLKISEVQSKDRRFMIEPSNLNETGKNERGLRLRRGRGFRDFQKEILPGLVTLSRHEICEDLHNIGYNLRRVRSRRNARDNWFVPVRSRRSKLCSGRRMRSVSP